MNCKKVAYLVAGLLIVCCTTPQTNPNRIVTNPIDLNYAFHTPDNPSDTSQKRSGVREAADPVCVLFKGNYYLFASKSNGYWSSSDMQNWVFIETDVLPLEQYAPTSMEYDGELYWMTSDINCLYKTATPEDGSSWQLVTDHLTPFPDRPDVAGHDPDIFADEDNRVYLFWGCSNVDNIYGIELDPKNNFASIGGPEVLITHNKDIYGWERRGDLNDIEEEGWNEGPSMIKHNGRYYLQYASPGTQFDSYGDGLYVSDSPLGPYTHIEASPMSIKPGGWMTGAGHGDTFEDKYGNLWHVASTVISHRMSFERRIGFFPVFFTASGNMYALTDFSDSPIILPDSKVDFEHSAPWTGWMELGRKGTASASSSAPGKEAGKANDNSIKTLWSAESGEAGEWLCIDLGTNAEVNAVQTNFADDGFGFYDPEKAKSPYKYVVEHSRDGKNWKVLFDRRDNSTDNPHTLLVANKAVKARYIRIFNLASLDGNFSIFDLRIFGNAKGSLPAEPTGLKASRSAGGKTISFTWDETPGADAYILRWGVREDEMYFTCECDSNSKQLGLFSAGTSYYFTVDAFNTYGITRGKTIHHVSK